MWTEKRPVSPCVTVSDKTILPLSVIQEETRKGIDKNKNENKQTD